LLKGSSTLEIYCNDPAADTWTPAANPPAGPSGKGFRNGSCLAYDAERNLIYALKGSYNEFFAYDPDANQWTTKAGLPMLGSSGRRRKAKDGTGLAVLGGTVYAVKGGNTNEFFGYDPISNAWSNLADMPSGGGKRARVGAALVSVPQQYALYATKGNNTLEFYTYNPGTEATGCASKANILGNPDPRPLTPSLSIAPNPATSSLNPSISYSLPATGNVTLKLYDASGKLIRTLVRGYHPAGSYSYSLLTTHHSLPCGVYILKFETEGYNTTRKLIIE
jgi:hypothetical protein